VKYETPVDGSLELDIPEINEAPIVDEPEKKTVRYQECKQLEKDGWLLIGIVYDEENRVNEYTLIK